MMDASPLHCVHCIIVTEVVLNKDILKTQTGLTLIDCIS